MYSNSQAGAGSSDWVGSFHALSADPAQLSRWTLRHINQSPMFNPLQINGTVFPTGTDGIIPTGAYYQSVVPPHAGQHQSINTRERL
jgi:hypothetical protein